MRYLTVFSYLLLMYLIIGIGQAQWLETTITVGSHPIALVYNPTNNKVYCANHDSNSVTIINGATNAVITNVQVGDYPFALVFNPINNKVYCANIYSNNVTIIDGATNSVITTIRLGLHPIALVYNPTNNKIYCAKWSNDNVTIIDGTTDSIITTVTVGSHPGVLCYNPTNNKIYCANLYSRDITIIDGATDSVITTISVGDYPRAYVYNPTNNKVYCANYNISNVTIIDGATDSVITTVTVGSGPLALVYNSTDNKVYSANEVGDNVTIIDGATDSVITTVAVGYGPYFLVYNPINNKVYCANRRNNNVTVIDGATNSIITTISVGEYPSALCWNSIQNRVYVANDFSSSISVIRDVMIDVGVTQILSPSGTIDSGAVIIPKAKVRNFTRAQASFPVIFQIGDFYSDTVNVSNLNPHDTVTVSFYPWIALQRGTHTTKCTSALNGDQNPANDILNDSLMVRVFDVGVSSILTPTGIIDSGATIIPQVKIKNFGNISVSFPAIFSIDTIYTDTQNVENLSPGNSVIVDFTAWTALQRGIHITKCTTALIDDLDSTNDILNDSFTVQVLDVGVFSILSPSGIIDSGVTVVPQVKIKNFGNVSATFPVWFKIYIDDTLPNTRIAITTSIKRQEEDVSLTSFDAKTEENNWSVDFFREKPTTASDRSLNQVYEDCIWITLLAGDSAICEFRAWTTTLPDTYRLESLAALSEDMNQANDSAYGAVIVMRPFHDIGVIAILAPTDTVDSGTVVIPKAVIQNFGSISEILPVRFKIGNFYTDAVLITLPAVTVDTVEFISWTAIQIGTHTIKCTTLLTGDTNPSNDFLIDWVTVQPRVGIDELANFHLLPKSFALDNCLPNPFIDRTIIRYALPKQCRVNLCIYNSSGILIRKLKAGIENGGYYRVIWDSKDELGKKVPKGVYFYRFQAGDFKATRKMVMLGIK